MKLLLAVAIMVALLGSAADKKAEDAAAAVLKAQDAVKAAKIAVREAVASRAKAALKAKTDAEAAATLATQRASAAEAAAKLSDKRAVDAERALSAIKDSQSTERIKSTLQLAGVIIAALIGAWGISRTGKIKKDLGEYKQRVDGQFTAYAALIKSSAYAEGKLDGEALIREVHRIERMNRSGG